VNSLWPVPPKIVILTGPGLSKESGFAPFDPETMPPGTGIEDVVTREGFERDPALVQAFFNLRRRELQTEIKPNLAHDGLAVLEVTRPREILIVTRNIDDLHERAGSRAVIHTNGELLKARCEICMKVSDWFDDITGQEDCPVCGNNGHLRPHIVRVGEAPLGIDTIFAALATAEMFVAIGAASGAEPARSFLAEALRAGAHTVEFNRGPSAASPQFSECVYGPLTETMPEWVKGMIAES